LVRLDILGFSSEDEYFEYFFKTLLHTNWTYDYFVEWKKAKQTVKNFAREINLLDSISKIPVECRKEELKLIFTKHPETIPVIPLVIAMREENIPILEFGEKISYRSYDFSLRGISENEAENLANFCEKTGVLSLFGEIDNLYAYLLGVQVGLDSNARKNRSGETFQQLLKLLLEKKMERMNLRMKAEDHNVQTTRSKRADFVIYSDGKPRIAIECNFYNTTGSKPIETANAYIDLQRKIREKSGFSFIWVTDGPAWEKMNKTVVQSFREIDFPINYTIAEERLERIVLELLK
jgi:type II restriction enzyme